MSRLVALALLTNAAFASPVRFYTAPGATVTVDNAALGVSAEADFVLDGSLLTVTLFNRIVNPTSVLQNISGLFFDVYTTEGLYAGAATIRGLSGTAVTVAKSGLVTSSPVTSLPSRSWSILGGNHLTALGAANPDYTVIGAPDPKTGRYSQNGSFSATPHNPFLQSGAMFTIAFDGAPLTGVDHVVFSFGTNLGVTSPAVPESGTCVIVGLSLIAAAAASSMRRLLSNVPVKLELDRPGRQTGQDC